MPVKVLIADDHEILLESLTTSLNTSSDIEVVSTATNGEEVLKKLEIYEVDVLVCDMQMPIMDGISTVLQVRQSFPEVRILMLTMLDDTLPIKKAIQAGASGYILKKSKKAELEKAIHAVATGKKYFNDEILATLSQTEKKNIADVLHHALSERELEVLILIAQEYSSQQIASKLFISLNTVESHRKNIFRKLNIKNLAGIIRYALQHKLIQ
ncbi:response regulator transcription factor [Emticicia sp. BO119]|uniref:response regulator n=1 Tax=Emticicia sp. BO119 TaxID=2757768 RepID=UPI0015F09754|nr:response regulator transcription factor [Emticicia sp. BO119]MBA4853328.1 response regulator transcription factor [Emticicia sp. BO119]